MTTTQTSEEDQAQEGRYELVYNPRLGRYVKVNRSNSGGRRCGCGCLCPCDCPCCKTGCCLSRPTGGLPP